MVVWLLKEASLTTQFLFIAQYNYALLQLAVVAHRLWHRI